VQNYVGMNHPISQQAGGDPDLINVYQNKFNVLIDPNTRHEYYEAARKAGLKFGPGIELSPLVLSQSTVIRTDTAADLNVPISLNANVPRQTLRYYFQDGAFVKRITATVTALRLLADGQPEPLYFDGMTNPANYVYCQWKRAGAGQVFQDQDLPLSEVSGPGSSTYFFDLIPAVQPGGTLLLDLTLIPPGIQNQNLPPFVRSVGVITVSLHCERLNSFAG